MPRSKKSKLLYEGSEWTFDLIRRTTDACEEIARDDFHLDWYPNQIEIITSEQMLDAYSSIGMPLLYRHWSFGKHFARNAEMYRRGYMGLAYEIVINSSPCISYLMEENTMTMQTLVIAHAAFGHNHFFKNNRLFRQWTDAESILDYLKFAKEYITKCEERYGHDEVEAILDSCHALMDQGVDRYRRPVPMSAAQEINRQNERQDEAVRNYNDLWRTVPDLTKADAPEITPASVDAAELKKRLKLPEENLLYFIEKHSPVLKPWQKEIVRIVRKVAQYFYPQKQTKVMNEGTATYVHYHIMRRLYDKDMIDNAAMLEFLHSHSNVVFQPEFDDKRYNGLNPYALGFAMMQDIRRIAEQPTAEDREWFPDWAGNGDGHSVILDAVENYRDESFIQQFLSPKLIRDFKLFAIADSELPYVEVSDIHNEQGYKNIRKGLARMHNLGYIEPDLQVLDVDLLGTRTLRLQHTVYRGVRLAEDNTEEVLKHVAQLWGYDVSLTAIENQSGDVMGERTVKKR